MIAAWLVLFVSLCLIAVAVAVKLGAAGREVAAAVDSACPGPCFNKGQFDKVCRHHPAASHV